MAADEGLKGLGGSRYLVDITAGAAATAAAADYARLVVELARLLEEALPQLAGVVAEPALRASVIVVVAKGLLHRLRERED